MTSPQSRVVGAGAGLGPATVILAYYLGTGGPVQPGLLTYIVSPIAAGSLIGAQLAGPRRAMVAHAAAYMVAAYLVHSVLGVVMAGLEDEHDLGLLPSVLEALGTAGFVSAIYFPFWALVLFPLGLVWVVTARLLRGVLRLGPGGVVDSDQRAPRRRHPSSLVGASVASAAALLGYTLGFMVVAPAQCTTTQTVSGDVVTHVATTVCSSVIGITYSGQGTFDPPREPAIVVGLVAAMIAVAIVLLALHSLRQAGRARPTQSDLE